MRRVLVIGYGNIARSDDAAGVHAAHLLEELYRDQAEVRVIAAHQLTPELAEEVAGAQYVLFLDAAAQGSPGEVSLRQLAPDGVMGGIGHHVTPGILLCCAEQLYGEAPPALGLTIAGESFELGRGLSPAVCSRIEQFVQRAASVVQSWIALNSTEVTEPHLARAQ